MNLIRICSSSDLEIFRRLEAFISFRGALEVFHFIFILKKSAESAESDELLSEMFNYEEILYFPKCGRNLQPYRFIRKVVSLTNRHFSY